MQLKKLIIKFIYLFLQPRPVRYNRLSCRTKISSIAT